MPLVCEDYDVSEEHTITYSCVCKELGVIAASIPVNTFHDHVAHGWLSFGLTVCVNILQTFSVDHQRVA